MIYETIQTATATRDELKAALREARDAGLIEIKLSVCTEEMKLAIDSLVATMKAAQKVIEHKFEVSKNARNADDEVTGESLKAYCLDRFGLMSDNIAWGRVARILLARYSNTEFKADLEVYLSKFDDDSVEEITTESTKEAEEVIVSPSSSPNNPLRGFDYVRFRYEHAGRQEMKSAQYRCFWGIDTARYHGGFYGRTGDRVEAWFSSLPSAEVDRLIAKLITDRGESFVCEMSYTDFEGWVFGLYSKREELVFA